MLTLGQYIAIVALTWKCPVVSDKSSQIQRLAVNVQVFHATDKLPAAKGKVVRYIGDSTQK